MKKAMRFETLDFVNVGTGEAEEWALMGGFNKLDESPSPKVDTKGYVHDRSSTSTVTGYEPSFPFESDRIVDDKANKLLYEIGRNQKTGEDAEVDYIRVEMTEAISGAEKNNTFAARKFKCAVEVTDISGESLEVQKVSGTLYQCGDFVDGEFNTETKTFTPAA